MKWRHWILLAAMPWWQIGCALLPTFRGPAPLAAGISAASPWPEGLQDYRGVIHCHSLFSHDSRGTLEEIQRACERVNLDFLIMTDHITEDSIAQGWRERHGRTLFIVGAEISRSRGSILALDLNHYVSPKSSNLNLLNRIHDQGSLAMVGHMEETEDDDLVGFDGMELYNIHANAVLHGKAKLLAKALFLPPGSLFRSMMAVHPPNFARWDALTLTRPAVGIFGNDVHQNVTVLGPRLGHIGTYEQLLKVSITRVIAANGDRASIMDALRAGHCYGALEIWGSAEGFAFTASRAGRTLLPGDRAWFDADWTLEVQLPVAAEIRLIRNGEEVQRIHAKEWCYQPPLSGVYRVEVWLRTKPWIFSNPIYLTDSREP